MRDEIHLHAGDPMAWSAYADWLEEQGLPWEQPSLTNSIGKKFVLIPAGAGAVAAGAAGTGPGATRRISPER
jgi:hypothetical protein